ncbi:hypothetical protein OPT61_g165 [Boeremia exigua]|uniref:Uncharacterized protein n=1 Tax=Boeremia exigua TaxID=749465 RepID=A0ACC2IUR9_9PLEO|nr:hypothetical protein OPT61_g165 [Boeremia exigua]
MQTSYYGVPHSDLPESVPNSEVATYKFSVPDSTPLYTTVHDVYVPPVSIISETPKPAEKRRNLTSWPLLLLYGLVLSIVAGVAGGFIGKTIERNTYKNDAAATEKESCPTPAAISTPITTPTTVSSASSTIPTSSSTTFVRTLAQPTTGCVSKTTYETFSARTKFLEWKYTTMCGQGWLNDELIALSAATPSDCMEACIMYNAYKSSGDRPCVGGGFIPEWWNQTRAMDESGRMPYNCFLKSSVSGIARNDKDYEVVALRVDGSLD